MKRPLAVFCFAWFAVLFILTQLPQAILFAAVFFLCIGLYAAFRLYNHDHRVPVIALAVICAAGLLACGRGAVAQMQVNYAERFAVNEAVTIQAEVKRVTWQQDSIRTELSICKVNGETCKFPVTAVVWNMDACKAGDFIETSLILQPARAAERSKGVLLYSYSWDDKVALLGHNDSVLHLPMDLQRRISAVLQVVIPGDAGKTASVICTGDKTAMTDELSQVYQRAGLSHLLAVSGLHLSVVCGCVISLFPKRMKKARFAAGSGMILFYILFTGAQNSVLRAGCMLFLILVAQLFFYQSDGATSLGVAVFLITFVQPFAVQNSGLLLSASATAGVLWASDRWHLYLQEKKAGTTALRRTVISGAEMVLIGFAAQVALIPAAIYAGLSLTVWSLLAGLLTIPLLSVLIAAGLVGSMLWCVPLLRPAGFTILFICRLFAQWQNFVAGFFASLPGGRLYLYGPYPIICCAVFILALLVLHKYNRTVKTALLSALLCLMILGGIYIDGHAVRVALVGTNTRPSVVVLHQNRAAVFWQGGANDTKPLENWLTSHGVERITLFCDISSKASQDGKLRDFTPDEWIKPADGTDKKVTFYPFNGIMVTATEQESGRVLTIETEDLRLGTAAGNTDLSQTGSFDLFFAGQREPGALECDVLVSNPHSDWAGVYHGAARVETGENMLYSLWGDHFYLIEKEAE